MDGYGRKFPRPTRASSRLKLGAAELAKSVGGLDESTGIYLLNSPKAYAASDTQEPQLLH